MTFLTLILYIRYIFCNIVVNYQYLMRFPTFLVFGIIRLLSRTNTNVAFPETPGDASDYQGSWGIKSIAIAVVVVSIISILLFKN